MSRTFTIRGTYRPKIRLPLPAKAGRPQTTKKGAKGYDRNRDKAQTWRELD
jgi:hypothetical protein